MRGIHGMLGRWFLAGAILVALLAAPVAQGDGGPQVAQQSDIQAPLPRSAGAGNVWSAPPPPAKPSPQRAAELAGLAYTRGNYPYVTGSTSAQPLGVTIACALTGQACEWPLAGALGFDSWGDRLLIPIDPDKLEQYANAKAKVSPEAHTRSFMFDQALDEAKDKVLAAQTEHIGTHQSYEALIRGVRASVPATDGGVTEAQSRGLRIPILILVARPPSADELALAKEEGVELDVTPVALDAFVFLVHPDNPTKSLTIRQIREIYTGWMNTWPEPWTREGMIKPFVRERNSGSQEMMEQLVMQGRSTVGAPESSVAGGMGGPYNRLAHTRTGIGYTFYYYHIRMSPKESMEAGAREPRVLGVEGVEPNSTTIADRSYPFTTGVYAVTIKGAAADSDAAKLRDWLLTPTGQSAVARSGYVPILPTVP